MASESSDLTAAIELPEFPRRAEFETLEEFQENAKKYYQENGLRPPEDFSDEEKKSIVEECTVNLIDPKIVGQKHNTTAHAVRRFVHDKGLKLAPEDLSKFPDFPKKTDDMSPEQYQEAIQKFWKSWKKKSNQNKPKEVQKVKREPPNLPNRSECASIEEFQEKTQKFYDKLALMRKFNDMTEEEYQVLSKKYYILNDLRTPEDFSEEEKKVIVEEGTVELTDPKILSQKYNTTASAIRLFVHEKGLKLAPADLSKYPDFPKKSDDMSREQYQEAIKKYWKSRAKKNYKANVKQREIKSNRMKGPGGRQFPPSRNFGPGPNNFGPNPNNFRQDPNYYAQDLNFYGPNPNNFGPGAGFGQGFGQGPNNFGQGFGQGFGQRPNGFGQGFQQGPNNRNFGGGPEKRHGRNRKDKDRSQQYQERKKARKMARKQEKMLVEDY